LKEKVNRGEGWTSQIENIYEYDDDTTSRTDRQSILGRFIMDQHQLQKVHFDQMMRFGLHGHFTMLFNNTVPLTNKLENLSESVINRLLLIRYGKLATSQLLRARKAV
jgi:hypothetical protein